ncbi:anti-sigma factor antagonist, partial [Candidatus Peregrinibacteria bacterium]|nr:anti-sigma factor antagonist [Candidatus Peregrinibacteria bacterium]
MTEATINFEDSGDIKIAHISGQLDESNVDEKIQELYKVVEENPKGLKMIFDLEKLDYMNSKSIGYMTDLYGKITESGGKVAIANAKPNIIDILQVVGLTQLIQTFDSIEKAKASLESEAAPAKPAQPAQPAEPAKPEQPAPPQKPAEPTQPTQPPQPT